MRLITILSTITPNFSFSKAGVYILTNQHERIPFRNWVDFTIKKRTKTKFFYKYVNDLCKSKPLDVIVMLFKYHIAEIVLKNDLSSKNIQIYTIKDDLVIVQDQENFYQFKSDDLSKYTDLNKFLNQKPLIGYLLDK